ncbi:MAG: MATE family efflux transporter [Lachnospira sp.]
MKAFIRKYIGDKQFYIYVLGIIVPMIVQNLITNFVSMLDNIMVGQVGTAQMSGVSIVNQFMFVFNISIFGGVAGASIFGTQFFGKGDYEGQKYTVRFRLIMCSVVIAVFAAVLFFFDEELISLFLSKDDSPKMLEATLEYGKDYLRIMLFSMVPFGIGQAYSSVVRECGETMIPMYGSIAAIGVNLFLDYALIFGHFGMPAMGVKGAAIATVIAKCVEAFVVIIWAHTHSSKNKYIKGLYRGFYIPGSLVKKMLIKGCPLLLNEFLWSFGMSVVAQSYSVRGLDVVAARNIATTLTNLFSVIYIQTGAGIGIIIGTKLGAGMLKQARDFDNKLIVFSLFITTIVAVILLPVAKFFPDIYNTEQNIKDLATYYIVIQALAMPIWSFTNACYFTLRSGGKTGITFLFDFLSSWLIMIPLAFVLSHFTDMEIHLLFAVVTFSEVFKAIAGFFLVRSDIWINNLVTEKE